MSGDAVPWVGFRIGGVRVAVEAARVSGVDRAARVIPVPFGRRCVAGVLVRNGRLVPVLDLGRLPSIWRAAPEAGGEQVVIVAVREMETGLVAEGAETFPAPRPGPEPGDPSALRASVVAGALSPGGVAYGVLNLEAALEAAGIPSA